MELYENIEENTPIQILSPFVRNRKGEHKEALLGLKQKGFIRVNLDNETYLIDEIPKIDPKKNHTIDIVIDRVKLTENIKSPFEGFGYKLLIEIDSSFKSVLPRVTSNCIVLS